MDEENLKDFYKKIMPVKEDADDRDWTNAWNACRDEMKTKAKKYFNNLNKKQ